MKNTLNFLLAGVGGQGTILASDVLVNVGLAAGLQAKQAEIHGMSQRGGSVTTHVRWGRVVYSPLVGAGEFDIFLAFEKVEALRNLNQLRPGALVVVNMHAIQPLTVTSGGQTYPDDERLHAAISQVTSCSAYIDGAAVAESLGNQRVANVVLLGALAALIQQEGLARFCEIPGLDVAQAAGEDVWLSVIGQRVPARYLELNRRAFEAGRQAVLASIAA